MTKEKQLTIKLLTEKLQKLSGKKVKFNENKFETENELVAEIKKKQRLQLYQSVLHRTCQSTNRYNNPLHTHLFLTITTYLYQHPSPLLI